MLKDFQGFDLPDEVVEALQLIGYEHPEDLSEVSKEKLHSDFAQFQEDSNFFNRLPLIDEVAEWLNATHSRSDTEKASNADTKDVPFVFEDLNIKNNEGQTFLNNVDSPSVPRQLSKLKVSDNSTQRASKTINDGVDPKSRVFIRGVLHKEPILVYLGSLIFLLIKTLFFASFIVFFITLFYVKNYKNHIFLFCATMLFFFILHILFSFKITCPICRQKIFKSTLAKLHTKNHYLPFLGARITTAIHILLFKWFRCMLCGTTIRLKK